MSQPATSWPTTGQPAMAGGVPLKEDGKVVGVIGVSGGSGDRTQTYGTDGIVESRINIGPEN
jgi:uncharacterized protein GlcG (DUF336 family)